MRNIVNEAGEIVAKVAVVSADQRAVTRQRPDR
jgi:hypothetical protein